MKTRPRPTSGPTEYQGKLRLLEVLSGLGRAVSESLDLQQFAGRFLRLLVENLDLDVAWLHAWRDGELHLEGCASASPETDGWDPANWQPDPGTRGTCRDAIRERRPIERSLAPNELGLQRLWAMPLLAKDRVIGCLSVARRSAGGFPEEERELLQGCASHLGLAVEHARFVEEERRRAHDLSRINELGGLLSQHLDLPALAEIAVNHLSELLDGREVFLLLLEGDDRMRMVACSLENPASREVEIERSEALATFRAIERGQAAVVRDPANNPEATSRLAKQFGHTEIAAIPLVTHQGPVGSIILGETRGREIPDADVKRAVAVGIQVSQAIFNARLFAAERQRLRELKLLSDLGRIAATHANQQQLLSSCLRLFQESLGFDLSLALPLDGRELGDPAALRVVSPTLDPALAEAMGGALEALVKATPPSGPARDRVALGDRFVHTCAVPLPAPTGTDVVLVFGRVEPPVTDGELQILEAAAPEIGVALENARRFTETKRRVEELRLLLEVGQTLTGSLDLEPVLVSSAEVVIRLVDACQSFIFLLNEEGTELVGVSASRPEWREAIRQTRLPVDSISLSAACIRARRPVQAEDAVNSQEAHAALVQHYGHKSIMAVPLLVRNEPIGCILVCDTEAPRRWTDAELERVSLIAHQIAAAAANARLHSDLRSSYAELARTQESLVKQERLAALGELAAVVAHEIRNPLGAIFNSLASLKRLLRPTGDAGVLLEIVEEEADRLDRIVGDLLDFTKPHVPKLEATTVTALVQETLHALPVAEEGLEVVCELEPDLPTVQLDVNMVRQALLNLVLNAIQAMQGKGRLTLRAERHVEPEGTFVRLTVADQGDGIPQEFTERIFQPFFTTKATGTGLGLAVVKRVVDAHHGRIHVESEAKRGTTFTLYFPTEEASP